MRALRWGSVACEVRGAGAVLLRRVECALATLVAEEHLRVGLARMGATGLGSQSILRWMTGHDCISLRPRSARSVGCLSSLPVIHARALLQAPPLGLLPEPLQLSSCSS